MGDLALPAIFSRHRSKRLSPFPREKSFDGVANSKPTFVNSLRHSQAAFTRMGPILCLINGDLLLIIMAIILQIDCVYSDDCNELNYFMKMRTKISF